MGYYEEKKKELDDLLSLIMKEKGEFISVANTERKNICLLYTSPSPRD